MKKFYFLLVAMLVGFAANADYYLIGGPIGWNLKHSSGLFTDNGDGTYVLDYNGTLTSGFKINDGTWSNDAANFGGSAVLKVGEVYTLTVGGSSGNIPLAENIENPHLVFNPTAKTLLITGQSVEAKTAYGIHGDIFGGSGWTTTKLEEKDGVWSITATVIPGDFGIKVMDASSESQTDWINSPAGTTVTYGTPMPCVLESKSEGSNWHLNAEGSVEFIFDPETMVLTVNGEGGGDDPIEEENYDGWYLNVQGDYNSYNPDGALFKADGTAEKENQAIGTGEFELKIWDGKADSYYGTGGVIEPNTDVTVYENGGHMTIAGATEGKAYNVYFNYATKTMKVVPVGGGDDPIVVEVPETLYIIGDLCAWNTAAGIELTKEGNVFTGEAIEFPATGENTLSFFNLSDKLGADWDEVNAIANRYGAEKEGDELVAGTAADVVTYKNNVNASACHSWTITPGKYDVKVDFNDIENVTITLTSASSSVDAIAIDSNNAAPVYYNLQGVQVNEPAAGLYIVRRGDKVAKEIVR
ncbi:MAG: hypothetical protein K2M80_04140 [Muribaculaceae bacterium]|nr:hypothetical protein [Muribaculaceae bacterium]